MSDFRAEYSTGKRDIRFTTDPDLAMGAVEGEVRDCAICIKGDPYQRDTTPPRGEIQIPGLPALPKIPTNASGRLELARWITSPGHPLTTRVMANRVWLHLFGRGLVRTVDDFGSTGEAPTHPELLDHLAARFVAEGWSVKKLIRSIMLSQAYRLSSTGSKTSREKDPSNELYGRMNLRRLEMEVLRDSLLTAAGRLTLDRPPGIQVAGIGGKGKGAVTHSLLGIDAPHRTVYLPVLRSLVPELYGAFDFPDPCQIMGQREVTTVAPQALFFLNSELVVDCARKAAALLLKEAGLSEAERVRLAYRRLLGRQPEKDEVNEALQLLGGVRQGSTEVYRWAALTQALMASAEFRYVR